MSWWLLALSLQLGPSCVYLRPVDIGPSLCGQAATPVARPEASPAGQRCGAGLPPSVRLRFLPSGGVCAGRYLFERVPYEDDPDARHAADLPEWAATSRMCLRGQRPILRQRRWWLPRVALSAERSLRLSPDGMTFASATTFWLTLSFPFPAEAQGPHPGVQERVRELCDAARRLNLALVNVQDIRLRTRAGLQMMAWRDELEWLIMY